MHFNHNIALKIFIAFSLFSGIQFRSLGQATVRQGNPVPTSFCIKEPEMKLFRMVNAYRQENNLPQLQLSKSLCYVAAIHAKDLMLHHPDQGSCNFHSWSNRGTWIPFCYPKDETKKSSVWDKPKELTRYPAKAWEIVIWENTELITDSIMMVWKTEEFFNDYLLNTGKWQSTTWKAIGIAVFENYACAWFGEVADPDGNAYVCGSKPEPSPANPPVTESHQAKSEAAPIAGPAKPKPMKNQAVSSGASSGNDSVQTIPPASWYIIVKTNLRMEAALKLAEELRAQSYPDAKVMEKDGKTRISVFGPTDKPTAAAKLKEVKKVYKDAWLLKTE